MTYGCNFPRATKRHMRILRPEGNGEKNCQETMFLQQNELDYENKKKTNNTQCYAHVSQCQILKTVPWDFILQETDSIK